MEYHKIIKVKAVGISRTKDIEVDSKEHLFYGNGIATSNSHAVSYAYQSYYSAYLKAHHPLQFYCSSLHYGLQKQDPLEEVARIANDAKLHDIEVSPPDIRVKNKNFKIDGKRIVCGLSSVKGIGSAQINKLQLAMDALPTNPNWYDLLFFFSEAVSSTAFENLVKVGGMDFCGVSRKKMCRDYDIWQELTKTEVAGITARYLESDRKLTLAEILNSGASVKSKGGFCANKNRVAIIEGLATALNNPGYDLEDTPGWIADREKELLGVYLTYSPVDECDTFEANCSCREFADKSVNTDEGYVLAVNIAEMRDIKVKNGKNIGKKMGYLTVGDSSGTINDVTVFSQEFEKYSHLLQEGNNVLLCGIRDKKNKGLIVKKVIQI